METLEKNNFIAKLKDTPKADLHVHLEGSVNIETLTALAEKNDIPLETPVFVAGGREIRPPLPEHRQGPFESGTFRDFIRLYVKISECICDAKDIATIAERYAAAAFEDGVIAAEIYVTPSTLTALNISPQDLFDGLVEGQRLARATYGVHIAWIFDIVRNSPQPAADTIQYAIRARNSGANVRAIGLAGLENGFPAKNFTEAFQQAKAEGFAVLIHAGETEGSESIWDALNAGAPERIGHGISALEDPELVAKLKKTGIPLEVCPWSNIALGIKTKELHPLPQLIAEGLPLVIASDDPGIFGKSLIDNFALAFDLGVPPETLLKLAEQSLVYIRPAK